MAGYEKVYISRSLRCASDMYRRGMRIIGNGKKESGIGAGVNFDVGDDSEFPGTTTLALDSWDELSDAYLQLLDSGKYGLSFVIVGTKIPMQVVTSAEGTSESPLISVEVVDADGNTIKDIGCWQRDITSKGTEYGVKLTYVFPPDFDKNGLPEKAYVYLDGREDEKTEIDLKDLKINSK